MVSNDAKRLALLILEVTSARYVAAEKKLDDPRTASEYQRGRRDMALIIRGELERRGINPLVKKLPASA